MVKNILSVCDGMSCGQIALRELGIKYGKYYASEIDRHCIRQTQLNFPDTVQLGDIEKWREWDINWASIGLILSGTPCTGFSSAGKRLGFDDPQSRLFWVFVNILNHVRELNPDVFFLFENVPMRKEWRQKISEALGVYPVFINSALVSAQNRKRFYWSNIRTKRDGLFEELFTDIPQPEDRALLLHDILENEVDEKYFISQANLRRLANPHPNYIPKINPDKGGTISVSNLAKRSFDNNTTFISVDGKAPTQRASTGVCLDRRHNYQVIQLNSAKEYGNVPRQQNRIYDSCGKSPSLMGAMNCKSHAILQRGRGFNRGGLKELKTPALTANSWQANNHLLSDKSIRRLTPTECARLQTIPDWYRWKCSDMQQYKILGNGWTVEVIKHILGYLPDKFFNS